MLTDGYIFFGLNEIVRFIIKGLDQAIGKLVENNDGSFKTEALIDCESVAE